MATGTGDTVGAAPRPANGLQGAASLDTLTAQPATSSSLAASRQQSAERYNASSAEEGLALLGQGSFDSGDEDTNPAGASTELLDYDSNNASEPSTDRIPEGTSSAVDHCQMDTDSGGASRLQNNNVISNGINISDDAVYHQCRTARVSSFKDVQVSVSKDETFGKTITIQTPLVGSPGRSSQCCWNLPRLSCHEGECVCQSIY